ncbi:MAG TPA: DMT family transporter [Chloroflexota bacterium]|nr:DMT family transporter [Chloroflexota bacterium]
MFAVLLALGSALSWGTGDFISGLMSRRVALLSVLVLSQGAGLPLMALVALLRGDLPQDFSFVPYAALASLFGQIGLASLFRGMAVGTISIVAPISATGAAIPVMVGLATGEQPTPLQGAGIMLAIVGVMLASRDPDDTRSSFVVRPSSSSGLPYALLAALGFGLFYVTLGYAGRVDAVWAVLVQRAVSLPLLLAAVAVARPNLAVGWHSAGVLVIAGALDAAANVLYAAANAAGLGGLAAVLASVYPVITVALAAGFLRERLAPWQWAGVASALAGIALIALR